MPRGLLYCFQSLPLTQWLQPNYSDVASVKQKSVVSQDVLLRVGEQSSHEKDIGQFGMQPFHEKDIEKSRILTYSLIGRARLRRCASTSWLRVWITVCRRRYLLYYLILLLLLNLRMHLPFRRLPAAFFRSSLR